VFPERTGQIEITIKKKKFDGVDRVSVKPSRYDKKCIDFFDTKKALLCIDVANIKTWQFDPALKDEIKAFFSKDKSSYTFVK
jgi:hypothetical protein